MTHLRRSIVAVVVVVAIFDPLNRPAQARINLEGTPFAKPKVEIAGGVEDLQVCKNPLREALSGSFLDSLPEEAEDALMDTLNNKEYPCESGSWWAGLWDLVYGIFGKERIDCSVREPSRGDPNWQCVSASQWNGKCIPASTFEQWGCLNLDTDAVLCNDGQPFNLTVYLSTDNVSLDCNRQTIDHGWQDGMPKYPGIRTPYAYSVSDVRVSNCAIRNTGRYGIDLKRFFRDAQLEGPLQGHRNITIDTTSIANTKQIGIYVGQNSQHVAIEDVAIDNTHAGIYLEAGSRQTRISGVSITNSREREAIAIDSSQYNVIEYSTFSGNKGGGIKLYKNCGENYGQVCPIRRPVSASHNVIRCNGFYGEGAL